MASTIPPTPIILTVDIGTSSTRAALYDASANQIPGAAVQIANLLETSADGQATFEPDHLIDNVVSAIDRLLTAHPLAKGSVAGLAMDSFVGNVLGVDHNGTPVTPVFTYADTRNASTVRALRTELDAAEQAASHDRTGCLLHTSYLPARFRWLTDQNPAEFARVAHWMSIAELIQWRLTGILAVGYSIASWTGLLNRRTLQWDETWLTRLGIDSAILAPLTDSRDPLGFLSSAWQTRWPALAAAAVFPALGDGAAANIGSGCDAPGRIALTIGTTGALRMVVDPALAAIPAGLWLYRVDAERALLGGATTEGGNLFAWLKKTLLLPDAAELERLLLERPPAAHELVVLPHIAGERAPGWNETARALFGGISLNTDAVDLVQAALEGVAYRLSMISARIIAHLPPQQPVDVVASGGALLRSPAWLQIIADVLNRPITTLSDAELTSRGIALLALEALGAIEKPSDLPPDSGPTVEPRPAAHARHASALLRQQEVYDRLYGATR